MDFELWIDLDCRTDDKSMEIIDDDFSFQRGFSHIYDCFLSFGNYLSTRFGREDTLINVVSFYFALFSGF